MRQMPDIDQYKQRLTPRRTSSATIPVRSGLCPLQQSTRHSPSFSPHHAPVRNILAAIHETREPKSSGALYIARSRSRREGDDHANTSQPKPASIKTTSRKSTPRSCFVDYSYSDRRPERFPSPRHLTPKSSRSPAWDRTRMWRKERRGLVS